MDLNEAVSDESGLVVSNLTISTIFDLINPLAANDIDVFRRGMSVYLFLTPFSTIFITQLAPLSLLSPYASLCLPM